MAELIGLDITSDKSYALVGVVKRNQLSISEVYNLISPVIESGEVTNLGEILDDLIKQKFNKDGRNAHVYASIYSRSMQHKYQQFPKMERKDFTKMMQQQTYQLLSAEQDKNPHIQQAKQPTVISPSTHSADYTVYGLIEDMDDGDKIALSVTAVKRHLAVSWVSSFTNRKFRLINLDVYHNANHNAFSSHYLSSDSADVLVYMKENETTLTFNVQGKPVYSRQVFKGSDDYQTSSLEYCQDVLSNINKISKERNYQIEKLILLGNSEEWYGIQSLLSQAISDTQRIEAVHWHIGKGEVIETEDVTIHNETGKELTSNYSGAYGMLVKGVLF